MSAADGARRSAGNRKKGVRKDAADLTDVDIEKSPVWSFCLDEEGKPGQDENTVKPKKIVRTIRLDQFHGLIRVDIRFNDGAMFKGTIKPTMMEFSPHSADLELWLNKRAQELTSEKLPEGWDSVIYDDCKSLTFRLPKKSACPDEKALESIRLVYSVLNTTRDRMWPITITPRVAIEGWPASWQLDGWTRFNRDLSPGEVLK